MKLFFTLLTLTLCMIFAIIGTALAADTATPSAPAALSAFITGTFFPIVGSLMMGVLSILLTKLGQKYHIEALTKRNNLIERAALQGIALAEEKAAQLIGSKVQLTGNQKLDIAIAHILSVIPEITPERAQAIAESMLAQIPGVGATGEASVSTDSLSKILAAEPLQNAPATQGQ